MHSPARENREINMVLCLLVAPSEHSLHLRRLWDGLYAALRATNGCTA
jgi:hypothetical protein